MIEMPFSAPLLHYFYNLQEVFSFEDDGKTLTGKRSPLAPGLRRHVYKTQLCHRLLL